MTRSAKKGPFIDDHLLEKVEAQNEAGTKKLLRLGLVDQQLFLTWLDTLWLFMMDANMFRFLLVNQWLDTNLESSHTLVLSKDTKMMKRKDANHGYF